MISISPSSLIGWRDASDINGDEVRLEVNTAALLSEALCKAKAGTVNHEGSVPTFILDWLPQADDLRTFLGSEEGARMGTMAVLLAA